MNPEVDSRRRNLKVLIPANIEGNKKRVSRVKSLRVRAKAALLGHLNNELRWEKLITQQMFFLLERIYAICGDQYDVKLIVDGTLVRARVDGFDFISTYHDLREISLSNNSSRNFGVRLWWECRSCGRVETSDAIFTLYDLGQQLVDHHDDRDG
ncbi:MAG: hypothetical protein H7Y30_06630 [Pyrinomonadaceae bacterium]|nr:hypothetical protein [Pyrinomonadaceae bacterium]